MPIVIPSNRIYKIPNELSYPKNKISVVDGQVNELREVSGNILEQEYVFSFYNTSIADNVKNFEYIGENNPSDLIVFDTKDIVSGAPPYSIIRTDAYGRISVPVPTATNLKSSIEGYNLRLVLKYDAPKYDGESFSTLYNQEYILNLWKNNIRSDVNIEISNAEFSNDAILSFDFSFPIQITAGTMYLQSAIVSVEGIYYQYNSISAKYPDNVKTSNFSLPSNELVQSKSTYSNANYWKYLSQKVIEKYSQGKKTITIRCSIGEYFTDKKVLAVSPHNENFPPTFSLHDLVIPYAYTPQGDMPLGVDEEGNIEQYEIVGLQFINSGAIWQEITLQENGVIPAIEVKAQQKVVTPSTMDIEVYPDSYYDYLSSVTILPIPFKEEGNIIIIG
jgi:hypothetical protein